MKWFWRTNRSILLDIEKELKSMAHTVEETLEMATSANTRAGSIIALVAGLKQQLADALAGVTLPPAVQAKIDAIFDMSKDTADDIDVALNENVPPPEPPA